MSAIPGKVPELGADGSSHQQLRNFLTLKAKVIHTDELIRRYRERGQECSCLQAQLRECRNREASLQQGMVGLKAEIQALVEESSGLCEALAANQHEKKTAEARATNAELLVQQLTAQVEALQMEVEAARSEPSIKDERDRLAEQCSKLKKALLWSLGRGPRRHFSTSIPSLPTSPPLCPAHSPPAPQVASEDIPTLTPVSLPDDNSSLLQPQVTKVSGNNLRSVDDAVLSPGSEFNEDKDGDQSTVNLLELVFYHNPVTPLVSDLNECPLGSGVNEDTTVDVTPLASEVNECTVTPPGSGVNENATVDVTPPVSEANECTVTPLESGVNEDTTVAVTPLGSEANGAVNVTPLGSGVDEDTTVAVTPLGSEANGAVNVTPLGSGVDEDTTVAVTPLGSEANGAVNVTPLGSGVDEDTTVAVTPLGSEANGAVNVTLLGSGVDEDTTVAVTPLGSEANGAVNVTLLGSGVDEDTTVAVTPLGSEANGAVNVTPLGSGVDEDTTVAVTPLGSEANGAVTVTPPGSKVNGAVNITPLGSEVSSAVNITPLQLEGSGAVNITPLGSEINDSNGDMLKSLGSVVSVGENAYTGALNATLEVRGCDGRSVTVLGSECMMAEGRDGYAVSDGAEGNSAGDGERRGNSPDEQPLVPTNDGNMSGLDLSISDCSSVCSDQDEMDISQDKMDIDQAEIRMVNSVYADQDERRVMNCACGKRDAAHSVYNVPDEVDAVSATGSPVPATFVGTNQYSSSISRALSPIPSYHSPCSSSFPHHLQLPSQSPLHLSHSPPHSPLSSHISPLPSPLVHAAADTMNSDSDSELSLSEVESLSPIPPSPHPRLPTLSPLPPSPHPRLPTLSPLPLSPAKQALSPLPHSPLPHPPTASILPEFVTVAPDSSSVCIPVPSVRVTSSPPLSASLSHPHLLHPHKSTLHRSHCSPFSSTRQTLTVLPPVPAVAQPPPETLSPNSQSHTSPSPTTQLQSPMATSQQATSPALQSAIVSHPASQPPASRSPTPPLTSLHSLTEPLQSSQSPAPPLLASQSPTSPLPSSQPPSQSPIPPLPSCSLTPPLPPSQSPTPPLSPSQSPIPPLLPSHSLTPPLPSSRSPTPPLSHLQSPIPPLSHLQSPIPPLLPSHSLTSPLPSSQPPTPPLSPSIPPLPSHSLTPPLPSSQPPSPPLPPSIPPLHSLTSPLPCSLPPSPPLPPSIPPLPSHSLTSPLPSSQSPTPPLPSHSLTPPLPSSQPPSPPLPPSIPPLHSLSSPLPCSQPPSPPLPPSIPPLPSHSLTSPLPSSQPPSPPLPPSIPPLHSLTSPLPCSQPPSPPLPPSIPPLPPHSLTPPLPSSQTPSPPLPPSIPPLHSLTSPLPCSQPPSPPLPPSIPPLHSHSLTSPLPSSQPPSPPLPPSIPPLPSHSLTPPLPSSQSPTPPLPPSIPPLHSLTSPLPCSLPPSPPLPLSIPPLPSHSLTPPLPCSQPPTPPLPPSVEKTHDSCSVLAVDAAPAKEAEVLLGGGYECGIVTEHMVLSSPVVTSMIGQLGQEGNVRTDGASTCGTGIDDMQSDGKDVEEELKLPKQECSGMREAGVVEHGQTEQASSASCNERETEGRNMADGADLMEVQLEKGELEEGELEESDEESTTFEGASGKEGRSDGLAVPPENNSNQKYEHHTFHRRLCDKNLSTAHGASSAEKFRTKRIPCAVSHIPSVRKALPTPFTLTHRALDILSALRPAPKLSEPSSTGNISSSDVCTTPAYQLPGYSLRCRKVHFKEITPRKRKQRMYPSKPPQPKASKLEDKGSESELSLTGDRNPAGSRERDDTGGSTVQSRLSESPSNSECLREGSAATIAVEDRSSDSDELQIIDEEASDQPQGAPHSTPQGAANSTPQQGASHSAPQGTGYSTQPQVAPLSNPQVVGYSTQPSTPQGVGYSTQLQVAPHPHPQGVRYSAQLQGSSHSTPQGVGYSTQPQGAPHSHPQGVGYSTQLQVTPHPSQQEAGCSTQPQGAHSMQSQGSSSDTSCSRHVLLTDRATGQVEEFTPLSSPGESEVSAELPVQLSSLRPTDPAVGAPGPAPSVLQQSLCEDLRCPLPLPEWFVAGMTRAQGQDIHTHRKKTAQRKVFRAQKQKPLAYAGANLERLVTGQLFLSTMVDMFADTWNCPNPTDICNAFVKFLQTSYSPRIENVMSTYNSLCDDVRSNTLPLCPSSPSFPPSLLRQEFQLVALLYHTAKLNPSMSSLLPEVATALSSAVLSPLVKFHRMAAICRLFTAVCRLLGEWERVMFFCYDLLRKPLTSSELPVVTGMVGVWPAVFARLEGVELVVGGRLHPAGVEAQPLSYTLEVVVTVMMRHGGLSVHHTKNLRTLCKWGIGQSISVKTVDKLATLLLQLLQTSRNVTVEQHPCQGWCRPKPSRLTFHLVHTLRLLAWFKGWVWTSDVLIRAHLWPILQTWNSKKDSVPEATVMAVVRLLGFIGQHGAESGTSSLSRLHKLLLSLLLRPLETPLSIQLSAAESLLDLCPPSLISSREAVVVLWQWLRGLADHPAGPHLSREFCPKLSTAPPQTNPRLNLQATQTRPC